MIGVFGSALGDSLINTSIDEMPMPWLGRQQSTFTSGPCQESLIRSGRDKIRVSQHPILEKKPASFRSKLQLEVTEWLSGILDD